MGIESYGRVFEGHVVVVGRMGIRMQEQVQQRQPQRLVVVPVVRIADEPWHESHNTFHARHFGYRIIYCRSKGKACVI